MWTKGMFFMFNSIGIFAYSAWHVKNEIAWKIWVFTSKGKGIDSINWFQHIKVIRSKQKKRPVKDQAVKIQRNKNPVIQEFKILNFLKTLKRKIIKKKSNDHYKN